MPTMDSDHVMLPVIRELTRNVSNSANTRHVSVFAIERFRELTGLLVSGILLAIGIILFTCHRAVLHGHPHRLLALTVTCDQGTLSRWVQARAPASKTSRRRPFRPSLPSIPRQGGSPARPRRGARACRWRNKVPYDQYRLKQRHTDQSAV